MSNSAIGFNSKPKDSKTDKDDDYIPHGIPARQLIQPAVERYSRRSKRRFPPPSKQEQDPVSVYVYFWLCHLNILYLMQTTNECH